MITGLYKPEDGNAWISGFDILNDLEQVQLQIGCFILQINNICFLNYKKINNFLGVCP
jgi:ABC-type Na+ transport system ATPase subunit NatA